jgi:hypothetical protein
MATVTAFYTAKAKKAYQLFKAKGTLMTLTRKNPTVDLAAGSKVDGVATVTQTYGIFLPASKGTVQAFDNRELPKNLGTKKIRFVKMAAYQMAIEPKNGDFLTAAGIIWRIMGCTPIDPIGTVPLVYGCGAVEEGAAT